MKRLDIFALEAKKELTYSEAQLNVIDDIDSDDGHGEENDNIIQTI